MRYKIFWQKKLTKENLIHHQRETLEMNPAHYETVISKIALENETRRPREKEKDYEIGVGEESKRKLYKPVYS